MARQYRPFAQADVDLASEFSGKAKLWNCAEPAQMDSTERDNDTIMVGAFSITKVEGAAESVDLLGTHVVPCDEYVVEAELRTFSQTHGEGSDTVEITRCSTFFDALKACAHAELEWKLDEMEFTSSLPEDLSE